MNPQPTPIEYLELQIEQEFNPDLSAIDRQFDAHFEQYKCMFLSILEPSNFVGITREEFIAHQLKQIARINYVQGRTDEAEKWRKIDKSDRPNFLAKQAI